MNGPRHRRLAAQRQGARQDIRIQNHSYADTAATEPALTCPSLLHRDQMVPNKQRATGQQDAATGAPPSTGSHFKCRGKLVPNVGANEFQA